MTLREAAMDLAAAAMVVEMAHQMGKHYQAQFDALGVAISAVNDLLRDDAAEMAWQPERTPALNGALVALHSRRLLPLGPAWEQHVGVHLPDENTGDTLIAPETCPACALLAASPA